MSQRRKIRREFVERDANGNITTIADDVAVYVMETGVEFKVGGSITAAATSFEFYHPGRVDVNSQGYIIQADGTITDTLVQCTARLLNGSGVWVLTLAKISGADLAVTTGDRIVHAPGLGNNRFATLYTSDTGNTLFGATRFTNGTSVNPPDSALIADGNGVIEFYTDETDVDLIVVQASNPLNWYGVVVDTFTGRVEETIVPSDWGDQVNASGDSWPALQSSIEYAEDERDRPVVIHIPAGTYKISGPLTISGDDVELWLDNGAHIEAHSGWSVTNRALIECNGSRVHIHGGRLSAPPSNRCILVDGETDATINDMYMEGGNIGVVVDNSARVYIDRCRLFSHATSAIYIEDSDYVKVRDCYIQESGNASFAGIYLISSGASDVFFNQFIGNTFNAAPGATSTGYAIHLVSPSGSPTLVKANEIIDNQIYGYGGGGIRVDYTTTTTIKGNQIWGVGGTNSGARDFKDGIRVNSPLAAVIADNTVQQCNGKGLSMSDPDAGADSCEGCVVSGNNFRNNAEEGIYAYYSDRCIINGNYVVANSTGAGSTFDIDLGIAFADGVLVANMIGTGGLQISIGALSTLELGHNVEL